MKQGLHYVAGLWTSLSGFQRGHHISFQLDIICTYFGCYQVGHGFSVTVRWMLPALSDLVQRTSFGASDISVTVQVRVVAWPDITFLSVPVIAGGVVF